MRFLLLALVWFVLLLFHPIIALLALLVVPVLWVVALPFRVVWWAVEGVLGVVRGILLLPGRVLLGR